MTLRNRLAPAAFAAALLAAGAAAAGPAMHVVKTATCGCCTAWVEHMQEAGFDVEVENAAQGELMALKVRLGLQQDQISCHTARVEGYVIEGHVPAEDVKRLLDQRPDAIGLAVPGMPLGSPGMDFGNESQPYETLLIGDDGETEVFARHR